YSSCPPHHLHSCPTRRSSDLVPLRQRAEGQFRHQHRARMVQTFHHRRVFVNHLIFESACSPRCAIAFRRQQILCTPRQAVQRPRSEEHTSELQSHLNLVCRLL